jgi:hypothetical protein
MRTQPGHPVCRQRIEPTTSGTWRELCGARLRRGRQPRCGGALTCRLWIMNDQSRKESLLAFRNKRKRAPRSGQTIKPEAELSGVWGYILLIFNLSFRYAGPQHGGAPHSYIDLNFVISSHTHKSSTSLLRCTVWQLVYPDRAGKPTWDAVTIKQRTRRRGLVRGGLISLWLYKENNKLRDWKNIFTVHIPPELHTQLWLRCSDFFNPSKKNSFGCAANRKGQRLTSTPT